MPDFSPACAIPNVIDPTHGVAQWEALSQDFGPFEIAPLVAAWVSQPEGGRPFIANVVVKPGARDAAAERIREHYAGALCIVERDRPTAAELAEVQNGLTGGDARSVLGQISTASADGRRGVVVATVWVVDQEALDYVANRWGDRVELHGLLEPVA